MGEIQAAAVALQTENQNNMVLQSLTSSLLSWEALVGQGRVSQQVPVPGYCAQDDFWFISDTCDLIKNAKNRSRDLKLSVNHELSWCC